MKLRMAIGKTPRDFSFSLMMKDLGLMPWAVVPAHCLRASGNEKSGEEHEAAQLSYKQH